MWKRCFHSQRAMKYLANFLEGKYSICKKKEYLYYKKFWCNFMKIGDIRIFCVNIDNYRLIIKDGIVVKIVKLLLILTFVCHTDVLLVGVAGHIVPPVVHIVCLHTQSTTYRANNWTLFRCRLSYSNPSTPPQLFLVLHNLTFLLAFLSVSKYSWLCQKGGGMDSDKTTENKPRPLLIHKHIQFLYIQCSTSMLCRPQTCVARNLLKWKTSFFEYLPVSCSRRL